MYTDPDDRACVALRTLISSEAERACRSLRTNGIPCEFKQDYASAAVGAPQVMVYEVLVDPRYASLADEHLRDRGEVTLRA